VIGAALFAAIALATHYVEPILGLDGPGGRQLLLKSILLVVSLGIILLLRRPPAIWGWAVPRRIVTSTVLPILAGGALGASTTAVIIGLDLPPMPGIREMGLLQIVTIIWLGSTLAEEVFVRGLIQGWMQPEASPGAPGSTARVLASGLLFGALHLSLFVQGAAPGTAAVIVTATTLLGLVCAWSRERSGSLLGPLAAHFAFNVAGLIGGIVTVIAKGHLPAS
jgi:membrane protease YdiL (CAAX protease family)